MTCTAPARSTQHGRSRIADGLSFASTAVLCAVLPIVMVVANKSAPASFVTAALLANGAVLAGGRGPELARRYGRLPQSRGGRLVVVLLALALASLLWTIDRGTSLRGLTIALPELLAAWALAAAWPMVARRGDLWLLLVGLGGATILTLFEAGTGLILHRLVRARALDFDLKRGTIPPALLLWPAIAALRPDRRLVVGTGLVVAVLAAAVVAHSATPAVGVLASFGLAGLAAVLPRFTVSATTLLLLGLLALAPWTGTLANRALTGDQRAMLREQHADNRIQIWMAFERHVWDRPFLGHGFNTTFAVARQDDRSTAPADAAVIADIHSHNMLLQIWVELGLVGACVVGAAFVYMDRCLRRSGPLLFAYQGFLAVVLAEATVALNAWDPWWLASVSASLLILALAGTRPLGRPEASA